jgi:hypothetical protein
MTRLPESLSIALWIVGATWFLAVVALAFDLDKDIVWAALLFGSVTGLFEWFTRRTKRS